MRIRPGNVLAFTAAAVCGTPKVCPGVFTTTGVRDHDVYTLVNTDFANPVCATVMLSSPCTGNNVLFSAAYSGFFNTAEPPLTFFSISAFQNFSLYP